MIFMDRTYEGEIAKLQPLGTFDCRAFVGDTTEEQDCANFVLALALAFNDLKDVLLGESLLLAERPDDEITPTPNLGMFGGLHVHFMRVMFGVIRELLYVVRREKTVREGAFFRAIVESLPGNRRDVWTKVVAASEVATSADSDIRFLVLARNKVGYHYDSAAVGSGFRRAFVRNSETPYLSLGTSISTTRFYFADRAAQSYLEEAFGEQQVENYFVREPRFVLDMAFALFAIVAGFLKARDHAIRGTAV